jgi:glyoxylase-like metal-dependent hydrolase (beta-lactamase superfamily II)
MAIFRVGAMSAPVLDPTRIRSWYEGLRSPRSRPPASKPQQPAGVDEGKDLFTLTVYKVGQCEMPGPLVFRTSLPDEWQMLFFYLVVIRGNGKTLVINTGLPENLDPLNEVWTEIAGPRCAVIREPEERTLAVLARIGLNPATVDYVLVSPFKAYLLANLHLFSRATVCVSRHGWAEHYLARRYPSPARDPLAIPDDVLDRLDRGTPNPLRLLKDDDEILPGLRTFWVGTHDPSSVAFVVSTAKGDVVISDCCLKYEHVEQMQPSGTAASLESCINAYMRIRHAGKILLPLYDPAVLDRFKDGRIA